MSALELEKEVKELRITIFNMLNFTNMYCLVLNSQMVIKFINQSLALDLGYQSYKDAIGKCWLDHIVDEDHDLIKSVHAAIAYGVENWEDKYREIQNNVARLDGNVITIYWFNSHVNSELNWTFSFGLQRPRVIAENETGIRDFYYDIIQKDRLMINSLRDVMGLRDKIVDSCKPTFLENRPLKHEENFSTPKQIIK
jgi:hypothetical protein